MEQCEIKEEPRDLCLRASSCGVLLLLAPRFVFVFARSLARALSLCRCQIVSSLVRIASLLPSSSVQLSFCRRLLSPSLAPASLFFLSPSLSLVCRPLKVVSQSQSVGSSFSSPTDNVTNLLLRNAPPNPPHATHWAKQTSPTPPATTERGRPPLNE